MEKQNVHFIGWLSKSHGIHGHLVLKSDNPLKIKLTSGACVFIKIDGLLVPFFVSDIVQKADFSYLIQFDDYQTKVLAEQLKNHEVYLPFSHIRSGNYSVVENVSGYIVIDKDLGDIGKAQDIIEISENPLIKVIKNKKEILIPFNPDIIKTVDHASKIIRVVLPEGLIWLFS